MALEALEVFTPVSFYSFAGVLALLYAAYISAQLALPTGASKTERFTFVWLAFDALIHFICEGSFIFFSLGGRTVNTSTGPLAAFWQEYAKADTRWGQFDPAIVSLELLTVFGAGPLCCFILYQLAKGDQTRHFWLVVLSTAEIYGGWMTFCPEWLIGSPSLVTENPIYLWLYLFVMNTIWVFIPLWLLWDSYKQIALSLRVVHLQEVTKKGR